MTLHENAKNGDVWAKFAFYTKYKKKREFSYNSQWKLCCNCINYMYSYKCKKVYIKAL